MFGLTSCDVNQFLEDVADAMEQPSQSPNTDRTGDSSTPGNKVPTGNSTGNDDTSTSPTRTTERATDTSVDTRNVDDPIFSQLELSNTQIDQYYKIRNDYAKAIKAAERTGEPRDDIAREIKRLRVAENDEIISILSTTQKSKYDQLIAGKKKGK